MQQPTPPTTDPINQQYLCTLSIDRIKWVNSITPATLLAMRLQLQAANIPVGPTPRRSASIGYQRLAEIDTRLALGRWDEAQQQLGTLPQSRLIC